MASWCARQQNDAGAVAADASHGPRDSRLREELVMNLIQAEGIRR